MSKYRNKPTTVDGIRFASMREAERYGELKLLLRANQIHDLTCQMNYPLVIKGIAIGKYVADFFYVDVSSGNRVIEDVKPKFRTEAARRAYHATAAYRVFAIKKKLMQALYSMEVIEV